jgi:alginate O-acetyltransferase complex protein AlgI
LLFNSFPYLLAFLPAAWLVYFGCCQWVPRWRLAVLLLLSIGFYGYWDWHFTPLIVLSIVINWFAARWFVRTGRNWIVYVAIGGNLVVLALFKYLNFFADLLPAHWEAPHVDIVLPLGISFFTFHHVMYLTDLRRKQAPQYSLVQYGLYIAFFPQVLAGPLVRWREVMHQFDSIVLDEEQWQRVKSGLMLIILGLCQKIILGDNLARIANRIFSVADRSPVTFTDAWPATLAFTFQILFDFSGYTDMALGSALLFGIQLPQNFNTPYRAASLQDFWRRWHMTLSRFLRDYLYISLGGNRYGLPLQLCALLATMTLGGLWHGAGLTFVAWGMLHGLGLVAGVLWRKIQLPVPKIIFGPATFLFVVLCWVLFRAGHFAAAIHMYEGLFWIAPAGLTNQMDRVHLAESAILISVAAFFAFMLPNTSELVSKVPLKVVYAAGFGLLAACALLTLNSGESFEFIYFHF